MTPATASKAATEPATPNDTSVPVVDQQAIAFLEQTMAQLRSGKAVGFACILHQADGSFDYCATRSVTEIDGMEAVNALGQLMTLLG